MRIGFLALALVFALSIVGTAMAQESPLPAAPKAKIEDLQKQLADQQGLLNILQGMDQYVQKWFADIQRDKAVTRDAVHQLTDEIAKQTNPKTPEKKK